MSIYYIFLLKTLQDHNTTKIVDYKKAISRQDFLTFVFLEIKSKKATCFWRSLE